MSYTALWQSTKYFQILILELCIEFMQHRCQNQDLLKHYWEQKSQFTDKESWILSIFQISTLEMCKIPAKSVENFLFISEVITS